MALRVLSSEEKQALQGYQPFIDKCLWAIRDYAAYWAVHDGSALGTEALRIKWAKDRQNSVQIVMNDIGDSAVPLKFVKLAKGMQFDLPASESNDNIILAIKNANKFEELASLYFDMLGEYINFSANGN